MKLTMLAIALNAAASLAADVVPADKEAAMAKLRGAAVASDSPEDKPVWDGIPDFLEEQPDYCSDEKYEDCDCYK